MHINIIPGDNTLIGKIEEQLPCKSVGRLSVNSPPRNDQQLLHILK